MAQAGIHGLIGVAVRKWVPKAEWLVLGIGLGIGVLLHKQLSFSKT